MQDHYETLQVHPKVDQEAIQAAYERLCERYDPAKLEAEGMADELVEATRRKRSEIERAYAVLGDERRRAAYDDEQRAEQAPQAPQAAGDEADEALDYRPLPPAQGKERPRAFDAQPRQSTRQPAPKGGRHAKGKATRKALPPWAAPAAVVGSITFIVLLSSLLLTEGGFPPYAADTSAMQQAAQQQQPQQQQPQQQQAPASEEQAPEAAEGDHTTLFQEYEGQVVEAHQVVQRLPDNADAWVNLGNALYDSAQVVRELAPDTERYRDTLPRWIEASESYGAALELGIEEDTTRAVVRSDMGVSLCYYGADTGDVSYVEEGYEHTLAALEETQGNGRVLLNHGICLVNLQPPRTDEALRLWRAVLELPAAEVGVSRQAQQLLQTYGP
jgi:curved DNA-binding protein CbpA